MRIRGNTPQLTLLLCALCALCLLCHSGIRLAEAKEIEATHEWTLLGENDTVDSGMHIRIDMTTGEKWVKLPSDDDDGENGKEKQEAYMNAYGGLVVTESTATAESSSTKTEKSSTKNPFKDYDFDMMHRTLSQLPPEEKQQMLLPDRIPDKRTITPEERLAFELRMKDIWEKRQEQLRNIEQTYVADMPAILKDRVKRIQEYLQDPVKHLQSMDFSSRDEDMVTHIVSVLEDLEYHLSDLDMTRDFFTMGGWSLLVSLLSDQAHISNTTASTILPDDVKEKVQLIQTLAAWVLGTAVKNMGEFTPYATAQVVIGGSLTTATDVVLQQFVAVELSSAAAFRKAHKLLYALGSLLRGNRPAQEHFCTHGGPALLGTQLAKATDGKTIERLLALANDIVSDVKLHVGKSEQMDAVIVRGFASESWCNSALAALQQQGTVLLQEKALQAVQTLAPDCEWDVTAVREVLLEVRASWEASATQRDPDVHIDLLAILDSTIEML
jgi:nucleotide exchange factor SIL1